MFQNFLNALGRGLRAAGLALLNLIWEAFSEIVRGMARGASDMLRQAMPWVIGAVSVWMVMVFAPELFGQLLVLGIMVFGFKIMLKSMRPAPKKKGGK